MSWRCCLPGCCFVGWTCRRRLPRSGPSSSYTAGFLREFASNGRSSEASTFRCLCGASNRSLQSSGRRWLVLLAIAQGVHLLAGHYCLAFITQLTCVAYAAFRVSAFGVQKGSKGDSDGRRRMTTLVLIVGAIAFGFALAAVQVLPTWELKQLSQREGAAAVHDPGYGHIPPWYLTQVAAPWLWYPLDVDPDQALSSIKFLTIASGTNKVEAHLYFGIVPLLLIVYRLAATLRGETLDRRLRLWLWLGLAATVYTTGWLLPVTGYLPGFSFFIGPGRYGIVATMAAALLAGSGLDRLFAKRKSAMRLVLTGALLGVTVADLFWVSRRVTYAVMVEDPPIRHVEESDVRRILAEYETTEGPVRMHAPGQNLPTLVGFAAYPVYLGLGPAAYYDPASAIPDPTDEMTEAERAEAIVDRHNWLRQASITHVLSMEPLNLQEWPSTDLVWQGVDRLLNPAWGRGRQPIYLYELTDSLPRVRARNGGSDESDLVEITSSRPKSLEVRTEAAGDTTRVLVADLDFPGWETTIDGKAVRAVGDNDLPFPVVDVPSGSHTIERRYVPRLVTVAGFVSGACWLLLVIVSVVWRRQSRRRADVRG